MSDSSATESDHGQALPVGTRLEEFYIERVLGSGGFGITYLALDTALNRRVVIKENLPVQFAYRETTSLTVRPRSAGKDAEDFAWSRENFNRESAILASMDHPGIVKVLRSFEALGTGYFIMPFVEGLALDELIEMRIEKNKPFSEEELGGMLERILGALEHLHRAGIQHRDLKPGNILITHDGIPVLIDFGSARQQLSERSMTVLESAGYTPFEQLQSHGNVGPWSDLYALGGTLEKAIAGKAPPKANDRMRGDPRIPLAERDNLLAPFTPRFLQAVDKALRVEEGERWQSASDWLSHLLGHVECDADSQSKCKSTSIVPGGGGKTVFVKIIAGFVGICVLAAFGLWAASSFKKATVPAAMDAAGDKPVSSDSSSKSSPGSGGDDHSQTHAQPAMPKLEFEGGSPGEIKVFELAPGLTMDFCWIPPGKFSMGSPLNELGRNNDETQHQVTISKGFWMAKTEVTQAQWRAMGGKDTTERLPAYWDNKEVSWEQQRQYFKTSEEDFKAENRPVERVNWNEARTWCDDLTKQMNAKGLITKNLSFGLPTEAEWEYACRAGTTTALNHGKDLTARDGSCNSLTEVAWYMANAGGTTRPVGARKSNAWGLRDMHGNVAEWCADWYGDYPNSSVTDPSGASRNSARVNRGGSWSSGPWGCRAAYRFRFSPDSRSILLGLRPVLR